jgi:dipeptidyl aminopeptidase/acylaminoacyl peptidase
VLAGKGYAVLQPNYRGSTGYGDPFLRDMIGHYFQNAHLDVMTGVDEVIRRGIADPDKLVKMGWSGGGHMTNKIITFTDRFKAAASGAGAANWISMYAQSDIRFSGRRGSAERPWQKNAPIEVYWNNSPLKDVANVKTPTIFFVGEKDPRVPMPQSIEMHRALKSNGVPTHLYVRPRAARVGRAAAPAVQDEHRDRLVREVRRRPRLYTERVPEEKKDVQEHQRAIATGIARYVQARPAPTRKHSGQTRPFCL